MSFFEFSFVKLDFAELQRFLNDIVDKENGAQIRILKMGF